MDCDAEAVYVDILRSLQTSILNPPSVSHVYSKYSCISYNMIFQLVSLLASFILEC